MLKQSLSQGTVVRLTSHSDMLVIMEAGRTHIREDLLCARSAQCKQLNSFDKDYTTFALLVRLRLAASLTRKDASVTRTSSFRLLNKHQEIVEDFGVTGNRGSHLSQFSAFEL